MKSEEGHAETENQATENISLVWTDLVLCMALEQQNVNNTQLLDIAVFLKLLANLRPDCGYREIQGVHGLNLGGLFSSTWFYVSPFLYVEHIRRHSELSAAQWTKIQRPNQRMKSSRMGELTALSHAL